MRLYRQVSPIPAGWPPPELDAGAAATLTYARQRDPIGDRVQAGLVALYVFTLAMPGTSVNDIAWASLAGCALVRLPATWRFATERRSGLDNVPMFPFTPPQPPAAAHAPAGQPRQTPRPYQ